MNIVIKMNIKDPRNVKHSSNYVTGCFSKIRSPHENQNITEFPKFNVPLPMYPDQFKQIFPPYPPHYLFPIFPANNIHFSASCFSIPPQVPYVRQPTFFNFRNHPPIIENNYSSNSSSLVSHSVDNFISILNVKERNNYQKIKLSEIREYFLRFHLLLKNLESKVKFHEDCEKFCLEKWKEFCLNVSDEQEVLLNHKKSINFDNKFSNTLKHEINKRRKKRKLQKEKKKTKEKKFKVHEIASSYMHELFSAAEQTKQEMKMKEEADNILSTVLHKKNDANYYIQLLTAIIKLYFARIQSLSVEKKTLAVRSSNNFQKAIETLKNLWENQLIDYKLEERGLRIMLDEAAVTAKDNDNIKLQKIFDKWLNFFFGTTDYCDGLYYTNYKEFHNIRYNWDKFVAEDVTSSSKIPAGWIIPKYNNNNSWSKYLTKN